MMARSVPPALGAYYICGFKGAGGAIITDYPLDTVLLRPGSPLTLPIPAPPFPFGFPVESDEYP